MSTDPAETERLLNNNIERRKVGYIIVVAK
jgi:hypothetical protein